MMYEVCIEQHFDAAHCLRGYQGKCESLHGHRFRVILKVKGSRLNDIGLVYDFTELKKQLAGVLSRFDHTYLNEVPPFDKINPSSENIAVTIYNEVKSKLAGAPVTMSCIEVWESPESWIVYRPD